MLWGILKATFAQPNKKKKNNNKKETNKKQRKTIYKHVQIFHLRSPKAKKPFKLKVFKSALGTLEHSSQMHLFSVIFGRIAG